MFLSYDMYRSFESTENTENEALKAPRADDFYDFLRRMPVDEPEMLACSDAHVFLNRFEFMNILWKVRTGMEVDPEWTDEEEVRHWHEHEVAERARMDSLVAELCGKNNPFLWQVAGLHQLKSRLQELNNPEERQAYLEQQKEKVKDYPYLVTVADKIYADLLAEESSETYKLPEGEAADIFRSSRGTHDLEHYLNERFPLEEK